MRVKYQGNCERRHDLWGNWRWREEDKFRSGRHFCERSRFGEVQMEKMGGEPGGNTVKVGLEKRHVRGEWIGLNRKISSAYSISWVEVVRVRLDMSLM